MKQLSIEQMNRIFKEADKLYPVTIASLDNGDMDKKKGYMDGALAEATRAIELVEALDNVRILVVSKSESLSATECNILIKVQAALDNYNKVQDE